MKKIPTIFRRDPERMSAVLDEPHPACDWVFAGEGVATRKIDGTCCKIDGDGYWKRREVKKGKRDPEGFVLEEEDPNTGKRFGWVRVSDDDPADAFHREAFRDDLAPGTYELLGPKIQGNLEGYDAHVLVRHADVETYPDAPRTFSGLREFLADKDIEGLVFHHPDGRMAKIKKRDFGLDR